MPGGAEQAVRRIVRTVRLVLDRLEMIGARADRLTEQVPGAQLLRAEDLTRELRHRRET